MSNDESAMITVSFDPFFHPSSFHLHPFGMSSDLASLIVLFILALALIAAALAGLWLYTYGTTFDPALGEAISQMQQLR